MTDSKQEEQMIKLEYKFVKFEKLMTKRKKLTKKEYKASSKCYEVRKESEFAEKIYKIARLNNLKEIVKRVVLIKIT